MMEIYVQSATWAESRAPLATGSGWNGTIQHGENTLANITGSIGKNKHSTAGSFVRPSRPADKPRGFLEALREKYASEFLEQERVLREKGEQQLGSSAGDALHGSIEISGKVVEEVGFDKIRKQLSELQELKIVLLDGLQVAGIRAQDGVQAEKGGEDSGEEDVARREIEQTCPKITELDLSRCLLSRWRDVADICGCLGRLRGLKLNGNRFGPIEAGLKFGGITELHLNETLLAWDELSALVHQFPSLTTLSASMNQFTLASEMIPETITTLTLDHNEINSLSSIRKLAALPKLERLSLRGNCIETISAPGTAEGPLRFSPSLKSVDLSNNKIDSWSFVNELPKIFPGLQSLRISGNPLYNRPPASSTITNMPERPMTVDEAYMLTLARLSSIQVLNYGTITPQDRSNGELYYLSLIGKELSVTAEEAEQGILAAHPRYRELCEKYGEPVVRRAVSETNRPGEGLVNPRSVAARLVTMVFRLSSVTKSKEIPLSFDTYQVKAIVSRLFGLPPFEFRLIWETDELDPVSKESMEEDDWDSEDDEADISNSKPVNTDGTKFVKREVELVDSTRDIGFWFQDVGEARVRVEM